MYSDHIQLVLTGIKKKLACLSTIKDCSIIGWCAANAPEGDSGEIVKRWKLLVDHIADMLP